MHSIHNNRPGAAATDDGMVSDVKLEYIPPLHLSY